MKIAIDCRYLGMSGIGRYLSGILENIDFNADDYYLIGRKASLDNLPYSFHRIDCDLNPFSFKGLFSFPSKEVNKCDIFFSPNFILPYGIKTKIFTTIHDVIFMDYAESNNGRIDYCIKKHFLKRALKKSVKVFTVSNFSRTRVIEHFKKYGDKLIITGNAVTNDLRTKSITAQKVPNSLIYVGNIKKHKGLSVLKNALEILNREEDKYTLSIVGTKENFRTADENTDLYDNKAVEFTGYISEDELVKKISSAEFLVQPSFYEGFGITPLEALYLGTKPIISDIEVFKEVYGNIREVTFFKCGVAESLVEKIKSSNPAIEDIREQLDAMFSYKNIAEKILAVITNA